MKNSVLGAFVILAIVIGGTGLAFGYLAMRQPDLIFPIVLPDTSDAAVVNMWFNRNDTWILLSDSGPTNITDIETSFYVNQGESVYFCFSGNIKLSPQSGNPSFEIWFVIDYVPHLSLRTTLVSPVTDNDTYFQFTLQNLTNTLPAGAHTISVQYIASMIDTVNCQLRERSLLVQTLNL